MFGVERKTAMLKNQQEDETVCKARFTINMCRRNYELCSSKSSYQHSVIYIPRNDAISMNARRAIAESLQEKPYLLICRKAKKKELNLGITTLASDDNETSSNVAELWKGVNG